MQTEGSISWPPYHWIDEPIGSLLSDFWEATYDQSDLDDHERLIQMLRLRKQGMRDSDIRRTLGANNVYKYLSGEKQCFVTHLRAERERLGAPTEGRKWLPLRLKPRGTPGKIWIQVPAEIQDFNDVLSVIDQLTTTEESFKIMDQFGFTSRDELLQHRANLFGFLQGVTIGDAIKPLRSNSRFPSMTLALTLSKGKSNSFKFGEFTSLSANTSLGLQMHRITDAPQSEHRFTKEECYRWLAPASPLLGWAFRACLGLKQGERTTYNQVRMDWILRAPASFRVHFLQGLAESDGWVDAGADRVKIVSSPNERLLTDLFAGFSINSKIFNQPSATRIEIGTEDGLSLPVFNPKLHSKYYDDLVTMGTAKRFPERLALPDWFIEKIRPILLANSEYNQACLEVARTTGFKISSDTVKKYMTKAKA
jgi:hypothetical protein